MRCRDCAEGRRFTEDSYYCVMYGMIIREKDKCTRKGARRREEDGTDDGDVRGGAAGRADHGGADQRTG